MTLFSLVRRTPLLLSSLAAALAALPGCGSQGGDGGGLTEGPAPYSIERSSVARDMAPPVAKADLSALAAGNQAFAIDLYHQLASASTADGKNLLYSPYSISLTLAMLLAGTTGETAAQMAASLHFSLPHPALDAAFDSTQLALASRGQDATGAAGKTFHLALAQAVLLSAYGTQTGIRKLAAPASPFLDTMQKYYGAGVFEGDFFDNQRAGVNAINSWVSQQTEGQIPGLLDPAASPPPGPVGVELAVILLDAITFSARWATPFAPEATRPSTFTRADGSPVQVPMMTGTDDLPYAETDAFQAVQLPYSDANLSMLVVMPKGAPLATLEATLTPAWLDAVVASLAPARLSPLTLPRFAVSSGSMDLKPTLAALGMVDAFGGFGGAPRGDFMNLVANPNFVMGAVQHSASISIDEAGTRAAAATTVTTGTYPSAVPLPPKVVQMNVDRPFLYVIRDAPTGAVLFVGRINDPAPL